MKNKTYDKSNSEIISQYNIDERLLTLIDSDAFAVLPIIIIL
jgi:hypothetical protein